MCLFAIRLRRRLATATWYRHSISRDASGARRPGAALRSATEGPEPGVCAAGCRSVLDARGAVLRQQACNRSDQPGTSLALARCDHNSRPQPDRCLSLRGNVFERLSAAGSGATEAGYRAAGTWNSRESGILALLRRSWIYLLL